MNRCLASRLRATRHTAALALGLMVFGLAPAALAQNQPRPFPANALRGTLVVVQPPVIQLDGKTAQLSPGARIRGPNNMLLMSGALLNQELLVNYTVESHGLVHDVWILTEAEAAEKRKRAGQ